MDCNKKEKLFKSFSDCRQMYSLNLFEKVLIKLFQKFARWRLRKPPRPPQRAKIPIVQSATRE